jgi:cytochrome c-type biogenesis protein CcmF
MAAWAATVSFAGGQMRRSDLIESGERAIYATLAMVVLASLGLWTALLTHDFSIKYVASFTSANLPKVYTITAFWGGQSGSLLFWALILSSYSAITLWTNRSRNRELMPYVSGTLAPFWFSFSRRYVSGRIHSSGLTGFRPTVVD